MTIEELSSASRCRDCGTWLPEEASTCPTCGRERDLPRANLAARFISPRPLIVVAAAAAILAVGILIGWTIGPPDGWGPSPIPTLSSTAARVSPSPRPSPTPSRSGPAAFIISRRTSNIGFSLAVGRGWESFGPEYPNYITKGNVRGPQGAEALIYWTDIPGGFPAEQCHYLRTQDLGRSAADLAAVVAAAPGTNLMTSPVEVTLGGLPAQHVALVVREDVGCDPGFFFTYPSVFGGALWPETVPGDTIRVWIVDVGGDLLFITAATHSNASAGLKQDVVDVVHSIRFE